MGVRRQLGVYSEVGDLDAMSEQQVEVCGAHPSKNAKGEAADFVIVPTKS
jgi:hypothetical protein